MAGDAVLARSDLVREAMISGVINAVFSAGATMLVFGAHPLVPLRGVHGLVGDSLPQSFAVTLMASLVPSLLVNRKHALGGSRAIVGRSLVMAVCVAAVAFALHWAALPSGAIPFRTAAILKILYGAMLGALVTAASLRRWAA